MNTSAKPTNKVVAGVLAGAITAIGVWALKNYGHADMPAEIQAAAQVIVTFIVQYFVPDTAEGA